MQSDRRSIMTYLGRGKTWLRNRSLLWCWILLLLLLRFRSLLRWWWRRRNNDRLCAREWQWLDLRTSWSSELNRVNLDILAILLQSQSWRSRRLNHGLDIVVRNGGTVRVLDTGITIGGNGIEGLVHRRRGLPCLGGVVDGRWHRRNIILASTMALTWWGKVVRLIDRFCNCAK